MPNQTKCHSSWSKIYYLLASIDLLAVIVSLLVTHSIMGIYQASSEITQDWSKRQARYASLLELATDANEPGNNVFESKAPKRETRKFEKTIKLFDIAVSKAIEDARDNVKGTVSNALLVLLFDANEQARSLELKARTVLNLYAMGRINEAARHMAKMDQAFSKLSKSLSALGRIARQKQIDYVNEQVVNARKLKTMEYFIACLLLLMIICVVLYGRSLTRKFKKFEEDKHKQEKELEAREKFNHEIIHNDPHGMITINRKGIIVSINPAALCMFGYQEQEVVDQNIKMLMPAQYAANHDSFVRRAKLHMERSALARSSNLMGKKKDGSEFPIEIDVVAIVVDEQEYIFGQIRDITIEKETQEALVQAKREAEKTAALKSNFLATMSHEIRTPMNGILGMTQLMADTQLDDEQRKFLNSMSRSGETLMNIINDILDYSKLDSSKVVLEKIDFDLDLIVKDVLELLQAKADENKVKLSYELDNRLRQKFSGDPTRIKQVLLNLVSNAVKFGANSPVFVKASQEMEESTGATWVKFEVLDQGIGIKEEALDTLFEPFMQADGTTTRQYGGTGLGLSISNKIVHLLGGEIGVQSQYQQGARFWFRIPLVSVEHAEKTRQCGQASPQACEPKGEDEPNVLTTKRIYRVLVAEDNVVNQTIIATMLKSIGVEVDIAEDGKQATEKFFAGQYDLVLMDCQMPNMDGYEATQLIRQSEQDGGVPIIAVTANALKGDNDKCLAAGMNDYIAKPYKRETLRTVVTKWLGQAKK